MLDFWEFGKTGGNFECFQHNGMSYFGNWEFGNWEIPNVVHACCGTVVAIGVLHRREDYSHQKKLQGPNHKR